MNHVLTPSATSATMTSREIAELTGSSHDAVLKTIRRLVAEGVVLGNETSYSHTQNGQTYPQFVLDFRNTMVVVSGYSSELRAKIIDRWQELEASAGVVIPQTMAQALRLAADKAEALEAAQQKLAIAAPKVEFVDRYVDSTGNKGVREVAKLLGANERLFIAWLSRDGDGPMYRLGGVLTPRGPQLDAGRFAVKTGSSEETGHAFNQAKFTPKGVAWIAGEWAKHNLRTREAA